ncbi:MAG: PHP domain-containing protein, partial [Micromonosporaceae bacterium]|nr:PHP domain-containing protein [Micromonosporaceae bacterium]
MVGPSCCIFPAATGVLPPTTTEPAMTESAMTGPVMMTPSTIGYAELHCHSNFSVLDGASHPEELIEQAARLGLEACAITDHDGLYGVVRFAEAARARGMPTVVGAELSLRPPGVPATASSGPRTGRPDPPETHLLVLAQGRQGYSRLARTIGEAHLRGGRKGQPAYDLEELAAT